MLRSCPALDDRPGVLCCTCADISAISAIAPYIAPCISYVYLMRVIHLQTRASNGWVHCAGMVSFSTSHRLQPNVPHRAGASARVLLGLLLFHIIDSAFDCGRRQSCAEGIPGGLAVHNVSAYCSLQLAPGGDPVALEPPLLACCSEARSHPCAASETSHAARPPHSALLLCSLWVVASPPHCARPHRCTELQLVLCVSRAVLSVVLGAWSVRFVGWADWVDCRCFLSSVFLGVARRLELSPCNTEVQAINDGDHRHGLEAGGRPPDALAGAACGCCGPLGLPASRFPTSGAGTVMLPSHRSGSRPPLRMSPHAVPGTVSRAASTVRLGVLNHSASCTLVHRVQRDSLLACVSSCQRSCTRRTAM